MTDSQILDQHKQWVEFLRAKGAIIEQDVVLNFGKINEETNTTDTQLDLITDLGQIGLLEVNGEDAIQFLQGQLTCDLKNISPTMGSLGCYANLKGRAITSFRLFQLDKKLTKGNDTRILLAMEKSLVPIMIERLQKFIVFSKAELKNATNDWVKIGLTGPKADDIIQTHFFSSGSNPTSVDNKITQINSITQNENGLAILISSDTETRYEIFCSLNYATSLWTDLSSTISACGTEQWQLQNIRNGIATISEQTSEKVMPAEIVYDRNGGISFTKGCYAGQEVIARLHYKGTAKQDLYHIKVSNSSPIQAGAKVLLADNPSKSVGTIINSAHSANNTSECLAVLKIANIEESKLAVDDNKVCIINRVHCPAE